MKNQNEFIQEIQIKEETKMEVRKKEVLSQLTAFENKYYGKQEGLDEMLKLQRQMVEATFEKNYERSFKYYDIINHIRDFKFHDKHISKEVVPRFISNCYLMLNRIKAEKSGMQGEKQANYALDNIKTEHLILRNVELDDNGKKTEIDLVVITKYGVFILEVKNPKSNIVIDEKGNYSSISRTGETYFDKNIGVKCNNRKSLLENVIKRSEFADILNKKEIQELVIFTNSNIEVKNSYSYIKDCYLSTLPHIIDEFGGEEILSRRDMSNLGIFIKANEKHGEYLPVEMNIQDFKEDFATILAVMEDEKEKYPNDYDTESFIYKFRGFISNMFRKRNHYRKAA